MRCGRKARLFLWLFLAAAAVSVSAAVTAAAAVMAFAFTVLATAVVFTFALIAVALFLAAFALTAALAFTLFAVTVAVTTAFAMTVSVTMAAAAFTVMTVAVPAATGCGGFDIVGEFTGDQLGNRFVGRARVAGIKINAGFGKRLNGTAAQAAANDASYTVFNKKIHHGVVAVGAGGSNDFVSDNGVVFDFVHLEFGRLAEMLEDRIVLDGNSDFHVCNS